MRVFVAALSIFILAYTIQGTMMAGGLTGVKEADDKIQSMVDQLKAQFEKKSGKQNSKLIATAYSTQVVAGTNYFIKARDDSDVTWHILRVFEPLPHTGNPIELHSVKNNIGEDAPIAHF